MVSYGICQNAVCSLGYVNSSLDGFRRRVLAAGHAIALKSGVNPAVFDRIWRKSVKFS